MDLSLEHFRPQITEIYANIITDDLCSWNARAFIAAILLQSTLERAAIVINKYMLAHSAAFRLQRHLPSVTGPASLRLTTREALVAQLVHLPRADAAFAKCANSHYSPLVDQLQKDVLPQLLAPPAADKAMGPGLLLYDPTGAGEACLIQALATRGKPVNVMKLDAGVVAAACEASCSTLLSDVSSRKSLMAAVFRLAQRLSPCVIIMDKPQELPDFIRAAFLQEWLRTAATAPDKTLHRPTIAVVVRSAVPFNSMAPLFSRKPISAFENLVPRQLRRDVMFNARWGRYAAQEQPRDVQDAAAAAQAEADVEHVCKVGAARLATVVHKWWHWFAKQQARPPARQGLAGVLDNVLASFQQRSVFVFRVAVSMSVEIKSVGWW